MIKVLAVLTAVLASLLVPGLAYADSTYEVNGTWTLENTDGQPTLRPAIQEDTMNVTCRDDDDMKDYRFSDKDLVADSWKRVDGSGIMVLSKMSKIGQKLTITITCSG